MAASHKLGAALPAAIPPKTALKADVTATVALPSNTVLFNFQE
jgi:hypothetical protein